LTLSSNDTQIAQAVITQVFGCSLELASTIAAKARFLNYAPRAVIVSHAKNDANLFLLVAGHAQAFAVSFDGRLILVEDFHPGALFGEGGLVASQSAHQEVVAVTQALAGQFDSQAFVAMMENYACVAITVSRMLAERLIASNRRMIAATTLSASGRIHAELHRQAAASAEWTLTPAPVLSEFALLVQSTRETVSRAMSALEKRGIIRRTESGLTVIAPHRLEELIY
jgi:CRP/FNR family transcriptional regulator, cyclic AMP receptor protein